MKKKTISGPFVTQVASDVIRDGLGVELLASGEIVAEVFRCDADHSLLLNAFGNDVPLVELETVGWMHSRTGVRFLFQPNEQ